MLRVQIPPNGNLLYCYHVGSILGVDIAAFDSVPAAIYSFLHCSKDVKDFEVNFKRWCFFTIYFIRQLHVAEFRLAYVLLKIFRLCKKVVLDPLKINLSSCAHIVIQFVWPKRFFCQ